MYSALNMIWTHCEVYWALDFEPFENEWRAASGIGGLWCVAWRLFFGSIDHLCFCWLSHFLRKICSMIPLIVFVFVDFRIFNGRFVAWLHWSFLFSVIFAFFTRDLYHDSFDHFCFEFCIFNGRRVDVVAKPPWFHWLFFLRWIWQPWTVPSQNCMWKICQKKTAGEKAPSQYCRWKICRWEGVKSLQVRRCHPNTAGGSKAPSQNCRWSMQFGLGTPRMPMCGKLRYSFRCILTLSCARTFLQQKPVLKDIFSPARLQHINVNMLRIFVIEDAFLP